MVEQLRHGVRRSDQTKFRVSTDRATHRRLVRLGIIDPSEELSFEETTHDGSAAIYRLDRTIKLKRVLESEITGGEQEPSFTTHHYHPDNLTERYEVRDGQAYIFLNGVLYELHKGNVLTVPSMVLHQVMVPPRGRARLLIVMNNAGLYPHDMQHIPAEQHPDFEGVSVKRDNALVFLRSTTLTSK